MTGVQGALVGTLKLYNPVIWYMPTSGQTFYGYGSFSQAFSVVQTGSPTPTVAITYFDSSQGTVTVDSTTMYFNVYNMYATLSFSIVGYGQGGRTAGVSAYAYYLGW